MSSELPHEPHPPKSPSTAPATPENDDDPVLYSEPAMTAANGRLWNYVELAIIQTFIEYKTFNLIHETGSVSLIELSAAIKDGITETAASAGDSTSPRRLPLITRLSNFLLIKKGLESPSAGHLEHSPVSLGNRSEFFPAILLNHIVLPSISAWP